MNGLDHKCLATGCDRSAKSKYGMCGRHWFKVPKSLRDRIWESARAGDGKANLDLWVEAVKAVEKAEGLVTA